APSVNAFNTFAASYNPFYNLDSFYMLKDSTWFEFDLTPDGNESIRINCFYVDREFKTIMVGTSDGLFVSKDSGTTWKREFPDFNVVSIITHTGYRQKVVYIATRGRSKSDGIYRRYSDTNSWEVVSYFTNIATLISASSDLSQTAAPHFYLGIYDRGVFESRNGGKTWDDITDNTINLKITCLASGRFDPNVLFLGTEEGIFKYDKSTSTRVTQNETKAPEPKHFQLYQNYPNPFNNSTNINYYIPADMSGGTAEMRVYNSLGQEVRSYIFENQSPGMHQVSWDGRDQRGMTVHSGVYLFRIKYSGTSRSMKAVFLK
ncbi:T9SS type A sorting domain-containing protein, partial [candidate division KSB1 bacterium]|nr:T9SS type A sorting domain-containing protein [candidate division KSB1 bacterium]